MAVRLHRGGRTRAWLGRQLGGDAELGDRAWRRVLHFAGAVVLVLFVLPRDVFGVLPTDTVLLIALAAVLVLEALRRTAGWELPTIRAHEQGRVASYAYFAIGLSAAALLFPRTAAVIAILGAATIDPLLGELRARGLPTRRAAAIGLVVYAGMAVALLAVLGGWTVPDALAGGVLAGAVAIAVEGPGALLPLDDDLAMPLLPGLLLAIPLWIAAGGVTIPAF